MISLSLLVARSIDAEFKVLRKHSDHFRERPELLVGEFGVPARSLIALAIFWVPDASVAGSSSSNFLRAAKTRV